MANDAGKLIREAGEALDRMRQARGMTQRELGERLGVTQSTVGAALTGARFVTKVGTLAALADVLEMELVLEVRPRKPIVSAADPSGEIFVCPCGVHIPGPAGELEARWKPGRWKWEIWVPVGPSGYQLQVEEHVRKRCELAASWIHIENC